MADWGAIGAVGRGITEGLDDKRRSDESAQMKKLRDYQLAQLEEDQQTKAKVKGLRKTGTPTYNKALEKEGAGPEQAKMLDAQIADFGAEGAQATANAMKPGAGKAAPVKGIPYSASQRSQDHADLVMGDNPELGMKLEDRARTQGQQAYSDAVMKLVREKHKYSLDEYIDKLTEANTDADHPVSSFVTNRSEGRPTVRIFNKKTGEEQDVPVMNHDQATSMALASASPEAWRAHQKQMLDEQGLGIQGYNAQSSRMGAESTAKQVETQSREANHRIASGLVESQVAENKARAALYPHQAAHYAAQNKLLAAQAKKLASELDTFESGLKKGEKTYFQMLKDNTAQANKMSLEGETEEIRAASGIRAKALAYTTAKFLKSRGVPFVDEHAYAGLESPSVAARNIVTKNAKPKDIEEAKQEAMKYGMEYASEVSMAIDAAIKERVVVEQQKPKSNSNSIGVPNPQSPASRLYMGLDKARQNSPPGHVPGLVDIIKNY